MKAGWQIRPLGEVCKLLNGRAYNKDELLAEGSTPVLRVGNFFTNRNWYYSDLTLDEDKYCDDGDLLYAWSASFGPRIWQGGRVIYHYHIWKTQPNPDLLDKKFLFHFLDWDKENIKAAQGAGTTMIHVTKGSMEARLMPVPPLEEQRRIVAVLDKAFAAIATANANAQKNLTNARALFESYQSHLFKEAGDAIVPLGEMASFRNGLNFTGSSKGEIIRIVGVKDFQNRLWIPDDNLAQVQIDGKLAGNDILQEGDILTVRSNGNPELIGRCMVAPAMSAKTSHSGFTIRIRPDAEKVDTNYLCRIMKSPQTRKRLVDGGNGANISSLNQQLLGSLPVPVPSKSKQLEIVRQIDEMTAHTDRLRASVNAKLAALTELKQSLLQKAFAGELT